MYFLLSLFGWLGIILTIAIPLLGIAWLIGKRYRRVRIFFVAAALILAFVQSLICLADISGIQADLRYQEIRDIHIVIPDGGNYGIQFFAFGA